MPMHAEKRVLPYTPEQLFELVRNVENYPEFLPWCQALRIRRREATETGEILVADMVIGFKVFRERFTSRVEAYPTGKDGSTVPRIDVAYTEGPFKFLNNHWVFNAVEGGTEIDFFVDFEFRAKILEKAIGVVFNEAVQKMVNAFETRATKIYGNTN
ncbi:MAG: type II toxin-antitoxin system RatA family toxin [Rhodospirillaceae bacterium]|jgi:coenzyme Q-binding protein COQ10|nr:type II toxin-antitoxin system RatA family toxin [Rhodospirillaceae bacterium]